MTTVREIDESERAYWNAEVQKFACAHPLNAYEWGLVRSVDGWKPIYLCAERGSKLVGAMMILLKRLPFTPFTILHSQKMPVWHPDDDDALAALIDAARRIGERENAILLRITPNVAEDSIQGRKNILASLGFRHLEQRWSFWNSPRDVARIDLTWAASPDEILNKLDRKVRADIRRAQGSDATIEPASTKAELKEFYRAFHEFSTEKGFMVRQYAYQEKLWDTYLERGMGRLLVVRHQGMIVGGYLCLLFAGKCLFLHMGTPNRFRHVYSDDAGVWACIKWAKEQGCSWFSFRGVGTMAFKRKFKPKTVALVGYYDLSFKPMLYKIFYWCEFTLLPKSWRLIVRTRRLAHVALQALSRLTRVS